MSIECLLFKQLYHIKLLKISCLYRSLRPAPSYELITFAPVHLRQNHSYLEFLRFLDGPLYL